MVGSYLQGGLGNYLFEISAAYALALKHNDVAVFDKSTALVVHKPIDRYINNIFRNLTFDHGVKYPNIYKETNFNYNELPYVNNLLLIGYFQSELYFKEYRTEILELFSIDNETKNYIATKYKELFEKPNYSIHVRRGDYLKLQEHHPPCPIEYYEKAIDIIDGRNKTCLVFSDDIDWCVSNLNIPNAVFISEADYISLYMMSICNDNIIANSSFSWWGAWLNNNDNKKVVAPKAWFGPAKKDFDTSDIIPKNWIVI